MVLLARKTVRSSCSRTVWERQFEEASVELGWERVPNCECLFVHRKQGLFLSVHVDDINNRWKKAEYGSHVEEIDEKC